MTKAKNRQAESIMQGGEMGCLGMSSATTTGPGFCASVPFLVYGRAYCKHPRNMITNQPAKLPRQYGLWSINFISTPRS